MIDGPGSLIGQPASPIRVEVREGRAVSVSGKGPEAAQLRSFVETVPNADNILSSASGSTTPAKEAVASRRRRKPEATPI